MVAAGAGVHALFAGLKVLPTSRPESLRAMIDAGPYTHTFWLHLFFVPAGVALLYIRHRAMKQEEEKS